MTSAATHKDIITRVMNALAEGDSAPFAAAMAEDFVWRPMAVSERWNRAHVGRDEVSAFFRRLWRQFEGRSRTVPTLILADGDYVTVEAQGEARTRRGEPYRNRYCFVIRMENGKMKELREYFDPAHAEERLDAALL